MNSILHAKDIRKGKIIKHNNEICDVIDWSFHRQGRGGSTIKMVLKTMDGGHQRMVDCGADEKFNTVEVREESIQYMYDDGDDLYDMDSNPYEYRKVIDDVKPMLESGMDLCVVYIDDVIAKICFPKKAKAQVIETEPSLKSQTAKASYKPAKLKNGWIIQVPPFIEEGEFIIINTEEMIYESKA